MRSTARIFTGFTLGYLILFLYLDWYARSIAKPTNGGISVSEVLEGIFPGGLIGLLSLFGILVFITLVTWIIFFAKHINQGSNRAKLYALIVGSVGAILLAVILTVKSANEDNIGLTTIPTIPANQPVKGEIIDIDLPPIPDGETGELREDQVPARVRGDFERLRELIPEITKNKGKL